jgi:hypothetical protein
MMLPALVLILMSALGICAESVAEVLADEAGQPQLFPPDATDCTCEGHRDHFLVDR